MKNFDIFIEYSIINSWCRQIKCGVKLTYSIYGAANAVFSKNGCTVLFVCVLSSQKPILEDGWSVGFLKSGVLGSGRVPRLFPLLKDALVVPHGMSARSNEAATVDRCLPGKFQLIVGQLTGTLKNSRVMQCPRENNVFAPTLNLSNPQCDGRWEGGGSSLV